MMYLNKFFNHTFKILLIIAMICFVSSCGGSTSGDKKEDPENSIVSCGTSGTDHGECEANQNDADCMGCQIFDIMFNAVNANYPSLQRAYSQGAPTLMAVAFAVWLALRLLKYVSSVSENNVSEVWNEILRKAFVCTLCAIIVSSPAALNAFINTFIMPIFMAFLDLGVHIIQKATALNPADTLTVTLFGDTITTSGMKFDCKLDSLVFAETGIPKAFRDTIYCMFRYLTDNLTIGGKVGYKAMAHTNAIGWIIGVLIYLCFWVVKICFVFYLVDCIFQMGVILLLLPLFVMAYAFGPTKKWATSAFTYMIATSSFLMCFSVLIAMIIGAMLAMVGDNPEIFNPDGDAYTRDISVGFMCMLLIGFLVYGSMGVANQVSNALIDGHSSSNFQKKLKAVAQATGQAIWHGVKALVSWGTAAMPDSLIANIKKHYDAAKEKAKKAAGR